MKERCRKAVEYFHKAVASQLLAPMQQYIGSFNIKKAKTYYKNVCELETGLKMFMADLKKVRYNDIPLADDLPLSIPERDSLYREKPAGNSTPRKTQTTGATEPKIPSARQSFNLFNEGLSANDIAAQRGIGETTVMSHLTEFVQSGELPVSRILPQATIAALTPWVQAAIARDDFRLGAVKEAVGDNYSYAEIRLVMSHCLHERNEKRG
jgi:hypothetical protein